jgi:hypothetical protein
VALGNLVPGTSGQFWAKCIPEFPNEIIITANYYYYNILLGTVYTLAASDYVLYMTYNKDFPPGGPASRVIQTNAPPPPPPYSPDDQQTTVL